MTEIVTKKKSQINILAQPTDESCGPTCLHAVYDYFGKKVDLDEVIRDVTQLKGGGTLAVMLGNHALKNGFDATIYTYNLLVFDPSWFNNDVNLIAKLQEQLIFKRSKKLKQATKAYTTFLKNGGKIKMEELKPSLFKKILSKNIPILSGVSATYLYNSKREIGETNTYDDIKGEACGHFVIITDYDKKSRKFSVADPLSPNPIKNSVQYYKIEVQRVINAILLGIVTYDANILIIQPKSNA